MTMPVLQLLVPVEALVFVAAIALLAGVLVAWWIDGQLDWIRNRPWRRQREKLRGIRAIEEELETPLADLIRDAERRAIQEREGDWDEWQTGQAA